MSSILRALLLGIGLGMCAAGIRAWRIRGTHKRRLEQTLALRQAIELERGKAEAAQRAATRALALSELAKRCEALIPRADVAPFEPPPLSKSTSERMPADRVGRTGRVPDWTLLTAPSRTISDVQPDADIDVIAAETNAAVAEAASPHRLPLEPAALPPIAAPKPEVQRSSDGIAAEQVCPAAVTGAIKYTPPASGVDTRVERLAAPPGASGSEVGGVSYESSQELLAPEVDSVPNAITELEVDAALPGAAIDAQSPPLPSAQGFDDASATSECSILEAAPSTDLATLAGEAVCPAPPTNTKSDDIEEPTNRHLLLGAPVVKDRRLATEPTSMDMPSEFEPTVGIEGSNGVPGTTAIVLQTLQEAGDSPAPADPRPLAQPDEEPLLVVSHALCDAKQLYTDLVGLELAENEPMVVVEAPQSPTEEAVVDGPSGEELFTATRDDPSQPLEIPFADTDAPSAQLPPSRRFRPPSRYPSRVKSTRPQAAPATPRERPLGIDLRLNMHRGGRCSLSLLGRRHEELPDQVTVMASGRNLDLTAMQEGWFEGVHSNDLGTALQTGVQWVHQAGADSFRWLLSGRPIYVLAQHPELSGFVNTTRLELGQRHVVLCTQEWAAEVRAAMAACGAQPTSESGVAHGLPSPWIAIHGVTPTQSVQASSEASYLDCLCPHSDAELCLTGGIKLEANTWLAAFPPRISLLGDPTTFGQLFIDQRPAQQDEDGSFFVPGWDAAGRHTIAWATGTRSYVIQEPPRSWALWAHSSSDIPLSLSADGGRSVCGALVTHYQTSVADKRAVLAPSTNTLLIGALPGQIWTCEEAPHLPGSAPRVGFPPFDPIWAMPRQALRCDKRQASVMLLPEVAREVAVAPTTSYRRGSRIPFKPEVRAWCAAILDASRKGLAVSPPDPVAVALWNGYRLVARQLARSAR